MKDHAEFGESKAEAASAPSGAMPLSGAPALEAGPDHARLIDLEAANARLLRLVGELLVANQQLRERRDS